MKLTDEQVFALKTFIGLPNREKLHDEKKPVYENQWKAFTAQRFFIRFLKEANKEFEDKVEEAEKIHRRYRDEFDTLNMETKIAAKDGKDAVAKSTEKAKMYEDLNDRYNKEVLSACGLVMNQYQNVTIYKHKEGEEPKKIDVVFDKENKHMELVRDIFDRFVFSFQGFPDEIAELAEKLGFTK